MDHQQSSRRVTQADAADIMQSSASAAGSTTADGVRTLRTENGTNSEHHRKQALASWLEACQPVILCFSHLRWDFVFQRPQHLLTRFARNHRVIYVEEPVATDAVVAQLDIRKVSPHIDVMVPRIPAQTGRDAWAATQRQLIDAMLEREQIATFVAWYYTPMSLTFTEHLRPALTVYDCMDELSAFRGAAADLVLREQQLINRADVVFTGGHSLYEAKAHKHDDIHPFPSSVDTAHFRQARLGGSEPVDQCDIPSPRIGFYGVLDERFDTALLAETAAMRPDWHFVLVGPVVKIDPAELPRAANIHYLGPKTYEQLPHYLGGWDVAMMPFAINESTRFISPTKTPEYLAGGRGVVSTRITDVMRQYGNCPVVRFASDATEFVEATAQALADAREPARVAALADAAIADMSWDTTFGEMTRAMDRRHAIKAARPAPTQSLGKSSIAQAAVAATVTRASTDPVRKTGELINALIGKGTDQARKQTAYDYLIVGAGFAGCVMAERLASVAGKRVLVIDKRPHIAGNAYDHLNEAGLLIHQYGPHIFHTNSEKIFDYLSQFTAWRTYEHRVLADVDEMLVPMPINLRTLSMLYKRDFTPDTAQALLDEMAEKKDPCVTSEDVVVSQIGRELYEKFFQGYTRKQWGVDPSQLDKSVAARIPTRTNLDDRYFTDSHQYMPLHGYTKMFERMLDHPNIDVRVGVSYEDVRDEVAFDKMIYTGPIDEFFDHRYGKLPYRSLTFKHETLDQETFQPVGVVNYPSPDVAHTRITEYKYLTGQTHPKTAITYEFPSDEGDPYYPIPRPENAERYEHYRALADATPDVLFVGRLATYRYYNMDQVVGQALSTFAAIERTAQADTAAEPTSA